MTLFQSENYTTIEVDHNGIVNFLSFLLKPDSFKTMSLLTITPFDKGPSHSE